MRSTGIAAVVGSSTNPTEHTQGLPLGVCSKGRGRGVSGNIDNRPVQAVVTVSVEFAVRMTQGLRWIKSGRVRLPEHWSTFSRDAEGAWGGQGYAAACGVQITLGYGRVSGIWFNKREGRPGIVGDERASLCHEKAVSYDVSVCPRDKR